MPFKRLALIIPFDLEIPIPNDPVLVNILGVLISGWPGNPSIFLNLFNSEKFNFPYAIKELYSAGASCPLDEKKYSFRAHYSQEDYGLKLNNRGGNITWLGDDESTIDELKGKPCYYPFYKLFVDWNGDGIINNADFFDPREKPLSYFGIIDKTYGRKILLII